MYNVISFQRYQRNKRYWSTEEDAVEDSLMNFIRIGKTPGKQDCEKGIAASPQALVNRDWRAVKFYVHNRIIADQKKCRLGLCSIQMFISYTVPSN
jgi:hypothetical protein